MRIGIFTECYKPILNGVVNSINGFKQGLTELGHEVFIFCPNYKIKTNEKNVYYCKSFPLPGKSGYHYIYPFDNRKEILSRSMDIIHTQHPFIMAKRALYIAKKYNKPLVFTHHTQYEQYAHYFPIGKNIIKYIIKKWVTNFVNKCDLIIAPANGIKDKLNEYKTTTPIEIIPNGINLEKFKNRDKNYLKKKYHLKNWPVFIYVGRIAEEKNLTFLINAFEKLIQNNHHCYLFMVGGGPEEKNLKNIISQKKLSEKIIITGYLPYQEIPDALASSDIFVSASKTEVHPLTILEAMASKLPSIVFNTQGTGEIIENNINGIKTKIENLEDFVNAMQTVLTSINTRIFLGKKALEKSKKYSYLETSKKMISAYKKAIYLHNKIK